MENRIKSYQLFVKNIDTGLDPKSREIADRIRTINSSAQTPLIEKDDADLIIAIGGDGTFINAVTATNFNTDAVYAGIHTGTLGFLQNLSPEEVYTLIKYLCYEKEIPTRKIPLPTILIEYEDGFSETYYCINELCVSGKRLDKIVFNEYTHYGELYQKVRASSVIVTTSTGDTAMSMNAGGAILFGNHMLLQRILSFPINNAVYERFLPNPIYDSEYTIEFIAKNDIDVVIDGRSKMLHDSNVRKINVFYGANPRFINKFEINAYSKITTVREKILGYPE